MLYIKEWALSLCIIWIVTPEDMPLLLLLVINEQEFRGCLQ